MLTRHAGRVPRILGRTPANATWCGGGSGSGGGGRGRRMFATGDGGGGGSQPGGPWGKYLEMLESHPFLTRTITCAILNGIGEEDR